MLLLGGGCLAKISMLTVENCNITRWLSTRGRRMYQIRCLDLEIRTNIEAFVYRNPILLNHDKWWKLYFSHVKKFNLKIKPWSQSRVATCYFYSEDLNTGQIWITDTLNTKFTWSGNVARACQTTFQYFREWFKLFILFIFIQSC